MYPPSRSSAGRSETKCKRESTNQMSMFGWSKNERSHKAFRHLLHKLPSHLNWLLWSKHKLQGTPNSKGFRPTFSQSLTPCTGQGLAHCSDIVGRARHDGLQILVYFQSVHQTWGDIPDPKLLPGSPATHQIRDLSLEELGYKKRPRPSEVGDKGGNCEYGDMGDNGAGAKGNGAAAPPRSNLAIG